MGAGHLLPEMYLNGQKYVYGQSKERLGQHLKAKLHLSKSEERQFQQGIGVDASMMQGSMMLIKRFEVDQIGISDFPLRRI
jgi:hypothetical protein